MYVVYFSLWDEAYTDGTGREYLARARWQVLHHPVMGSADGLCFQVMEPVLNMELNAAGDFSFTLPSVHYHAEALQDAGLRFTVMVKKDGAFLWAGHPLTIDADLYGNAAYTCEGVLGYLSDVYLDYFADTKTAAEWFSYFLTSAYSGVCTQTQHSGTSDALVSGAQWKWKLFSHFETDDWVKSIVRETQEDGETMSSAQLYRKTAKNLTVLQAIREKLTDYFGGMLVVGLAEENSPLIADAVEGDAAMETNQSVYGVYAGLWSLKWAQSGTVCNQLLQVGQNITALSETVDYSDFYTGVVFVDSEQNAMVGTQVVQNTSTTLYGASYNILKLKGLPVYCRSDLLAEYGVITKEVSTEDDTDTDTDSTDYRAVSADTILEEIAKLDYPQTVLEVTAVDLSLVDALYDAIDIGSAVRCIPRRGAQAVEYVVESISLRLDDPTQNTITLNGTAKGLTRRIFRKQGAV